jgi:hypothetical protein
MIGVFAKRASRIGDERSDVVAGIDPTLRYFPGPGDKHRHTGSA